MNSDEIHRRIEAIRQDEQRGATELAGEAVRLLGEMAADPSISQAMFPQLFQEAARDLTRARPSMVSLLNGVRSVVIAWMEAGGVDREGVARSAVEVATRRWIAHQKAAASTIADHTAEVITGTALTLSFSSTVLQALETCWNRGVLKGAIVAESRPLLEGRRVAAMLASKGIPTTLITDAEMGIFVSQAGTVVVGADTIRPNGSLINKAGTLLLALAAHRCRVPFYTLAETHKIASAQRGEHALPLEEKDPRELLPEPIPGVEVRNIYFDLTPARFITGYLTERGLLNRKDVVALSKQLPGTLLENEG